MVERRGRNRGKRRSGGEKRRRDWWRDGAGIPQPPTLFPGGVLTCSEAFHIVRSKWRAGQRGGVAFTNDCFVEHSSIGKSNKSERAAVATSRLLAVFQLYGIPRMDQLFGKFRGALPQCFGHRLLLAVRAIT